MNITADIDIDIDEILDAVRSEIHEVVERAIDTDDLVSQVESEIRALVEEEVSNAVSDFESRLDSIEDALREIANAAQSF